MTSSAMTETRLPTAATLEPVRFGEFLRDRNLISDEQWLAALADHWSASKRRLLGAVIIENGFLPAEVVEAEARAFHDELDVLEVGDEFVDESHLPRSEKTTLPAMPVSFQALA
jgi:hypothetical protein